MPRQNKKKNLQNFSNYNSNFNQSYNYCNTPYGMYSDYNTQHYNFFYGNRNYQNFQDNHESYQNRGNFVRFDQGRRNFPRYNNQYGNGSYQNRRNMGYRNPEGYQHSYEYYRNPQENYQFLTQNYQNVQRNPENFLENFQNPEEILEENIDDFEVESSKPLEDKFVSRASLYRKSESPVEDIYNNQNNEDELNTQGPSWTDSYWKKHQGENASAECEEDIYKVKKPKKVFNNKLEKTLAKMLAKPVEMSKGKSLLMKMGWGGGGLGKDGEGIVEPIAPKATYASTTMGLGNPTEVAINNNSKNKKQIRKQRNRHRSESSDENEEINFRFKGRFTSNVLKTILNFVKNDVLIELQFEEKLSKGERKKIHKIVAGITGIEESNDLIFKDEKSHVDIAKGIFMFNKYILTTESAGEGVKRRISIFKEAPPHMYHIVPEDLRDESDEANENEEQKNNDKGEHIINETKLPKDHEIKNIENATQKELGEKEAEITRNNDNVNEIENTRSIEDKIQANNEKQNVDNIEFPSGKQNIDIIESSNDKRNEKDNKSSNDKEKSQSAIDQNYLDEVKSKNNLIVNEIDLTKDEAIDICEKSLSQINTKIQIKERQDIDLTHNENNTDISENSNSYDHKDVLALIIDYFIEFTKENDYEEFRFLGPFDAREREYIDEFFSLFNDVEHKCKEKVLEAMKDETVIYDVVKDDNGSLFISKTPKVGESAASAWRNKIEQLGWVQNLTMYD